jgi:DNA-binding transcriptional LysR family regulator
MLNSRQLEAFRAVMQGGAMTAAADIINVTQPAISRLIRDLESQLGLVLFERRGNIVTPTPEAHALLREVQRSFTGLDQINRFASDLREGRAGSLRIAVLPAMATGFMPRFIAHFVRDRPGLNVVAEGYPSSIIRDRVADGAYDLGVVAAPFKREGLKMTVLHDEAVVVLPLGHRLANRPSLSAADLQHDNVIMLSKFSQGVHPVRLALQEVLHRSTIETELSTIACVFVTEGLGVAIVDRFTASEFVGRGLIVRRFEPAALVGCAVIQSSTRKLSLLAEEFRVAFLEHVDAFLKQDVNAPVQMASWNGADLVM